MRLSSAFGWRLLLLAAAVAAPRLSPAVADEIPLSKILAERNAEHIQAAAPSIRQVTTSMIDSYTGNDPEKEKGPWELLQGRIGLRVELVRTETIDVSAFPKPVLTVSVDGGEVIVSEGSPGQPEHATFIVQIAEMDPGNPYPEIVFSSYTGGAHCCSDTRVLTSGKDGRSWSEIELGLFDGGLLLANDLDSDGRFELAMRDNRFLYTFGCYACSSAPLQVLRVQDGGAADVSGDKAYRNSHQTSLAGMLGYTPDGRKGSNGFWAGYVAQKIRLGEGGEAWTLMLDNYDRETDWGLDHCTVRENEKGECPPGKTVSLTYPEALKRFLKAGGYPLPKEAR